jgi:hypothetical protein
MATYKVIQDIEAEDKLVGPLTLRQFIYAGVSAVCIYICFLAYSHGAAFLVVFFLPVAAIGGFFAFPWKGEQPTEIWALARIRFSIKPRVRIWDQDGMKDLVTITVPKKIATTRSPKDNLTQDQVRSRLKALADTIDSRGWATRNAAYGAYSQQWAHPTVVPVPAGGDGALAAMIPNDDMFAANSTVAQNFDAMLNKSQEAQRQRVMQQMAQAQNPSQPQDPYQLPRPLMSNAMPNIPTPAAASAYDVAPAAAPSPYHQQAVGLPGQGMPAAQPMPPVTGMMPMPQMQMPAAPSMPPAMPPSMAPAMAPSQEPNNYWFANGPAYPANPTPLPAMPVAPPATMVDPRIESDAPLAIAATPTAEENAMGDVIKEQNEAAMAINYNHMRVLQPSGSAGSEQYASHLPATPDPQPEPEPVKPVTRTPDPAILEFANNDDLNIATIARQAKREISKSPDEVEIRLH